MRAELRLRKSAFMVEAGRVERALAKYPSATTDDRKISRREPALNSERQLTDRKRALETHQKPVTVESKRTESTGAIPDDELFGV